MHGTSCALMAHKKDPFPPQNDENGLCQAIISPPRYDRSEFTRPAQNDFGSVIFFFFRDKKLPQMHCLPLSGQTLDAADDLIELLLLALFDE
jgi:hypothetical protein